MDTRIHRLDAVENFRDFGGYESRHGGRIAHGRLFRSAHHAMASEADLAAMGGLGLAALVDLRRSGERRAQPSRRPQGFAARVIECAMEDEAQPPHLAFLRETDLSPASVRAFYHDYYSKAPLAERHRVLFSQYFQALAEHDGAVLIHCTAGKDRTGLLAALTHHLLGVAREDIVADYLLTNQATRVDQRLDAIAVALEQSLGRKPSETAVRAFLGVEADFLESSFEAIKAEHGSLDAYLATLGVDDARREAIGARLLA